MSSEKRSSLWYEDLPVDCLVPALVLRDQYIAKLEAEVERLRAVAEPAPWIPIMERMPPEPGEYEITIPPLSPDEQEPQLVVCDWTPDWGFHKAVGGVTHGYNLVVIAWRPLPSGKTALEAGEGMRE